MEKSSSCLTICVTNQKGGVGKTTTTINLASGLAAVDYKVLLIDMDPQTNATTGLGKNSTLPNNVYSWLTHQNADLPVYSTFLQTLDILPSHSDLSAFDSEFWHHSNREYILQSALKPHVHKYDFIIIDCPPALNLLTINSLVAAQYIIVPLQCEFFALQGLAQLLKTIGRIKNNFNKDLQLLGVVLTMFEKRSNLNALIEQDVRSYLKEKVFQTIVPRNIKVSEASSHGKPLLFFDFKSTAAQAYIQLAREVLTFLKQKVSK